MTRKTFCLYPFAAFSLNNHGQLRICCNNQSWERISVHKRFNTPDFDLNAEYNNFLHKEVRRFMIEDVRHPSCKKCWDVEDQGGYSYRQDFNDSFKLNNKDEDYWLSKCERDGSIKDIEFVYLDVTFGNKCNLKCIMCNGYNSTLYAKEQFETKEISITDYKNFMSIDWYKDRNEFDKIGQQLDNVQRIHIVGGEPLLIEHTYFLKMFIDRDIAKNVTLTYNTNLTTLPDEILETWKHFKKVQLGVSVDAYGKLNEFIRYPMKWSKFERNIDQVIQLKDTNVDIDLHTTFNCLNFLGMVDLLNWIKEMSNGHKNVSPQPFINYVYRPEWMDPVILPRHIKQKGYDDIVNWAKENPEMADHHRIQTLIGHYKMVLDKPSNDIMYKRFLGEIKYYETIRNIECPK